MKGKIAAVLLSGSLVACVQAQPPAAPAPPPPAPVAAPAPPEVAAPAVAERSNRRVSIRTATCARYLQLSDDDRAAASLFYIGYQASRLGAKAINVAGIPATEAQAIRYCEAHPNRPVADAFRLALRALR
jgi:hypothetical protein